MNRLELTFLGTGTAFNHDGRGSQSVLVEPLVGTPFLIDAGPTLMGVLMREGLDCETIDRLFLTHLHGDHVAGFPFLLLHFVFLHRRTRPFDVFGPPGTKRILEGLTQLCYGDVIDRRQFEVHYHELEVRETEGQIAGPGLTVDVLPMKHHASSIGLRFHLAGGEASERSSRTIAVSGDTGWCNHLEPLARGSDVLILECTSRRSEVEGHLSLEEIRRNAGRLAAERIVLVHLTDEVAEALAIDPIPRVSAAHDGMLLAID